MKKNGFFNFGKQFILIFFLKKKKKDLCRILFTASTSCLAWQVCSPGPLSLCQLNARNSPVNSPKVPKRYEPYQHLTPNPKKLQKKSIQ